MSRKKEKSGIAGILIGPILVLVAIFALWKNETRYDYYRAATRTTHVNYLDSAEENQLISFTGSMDQSLTFNGKYAETFTGFLVVYRDAEIYAWDEQEDDDDGPSTWTLRWKGSVENNARNSGVRQTLSSDRLLPPTFELDDFDVDSDLIEFVDNDLNIPVSQLKLKSEYVQSGMNVREEYFYLAKHKGLNLGDERLSYRGIPVPATATYFGKFSKDRGIAHDDNKRSGLISQLIQDRGVLHHIVAGERPTALQTMKTHITRLKWIVRLSGSGAIVFGFLLLFSSMLKFLFRIPLIGPIAEMGSFVLSIAIGIPLALATMVAGYLASQPLILFALILLLCVLVGAVLYYRNLGRATQKVIQTELEEEHGHKLESQEIKELEFRELVQLALSDSSLSETDLGFLKQWGRKQGWDAAKLESMLENSRAGAGQSSQTTSTENHLQNLIRLALADGTLSPFEIRTIRNTAQKVGYDHRRVNQLIDTVSRSAQLRSNILQNNA